MRDVHSSSLLIDAYYVFSSSSYVSLRRQASMTQAEKFRDPCSRAKRLVQSFG